MQELSSILEFVPDLKPENRKGFAAAEEREEDDKTLQAKEAKRKLQTFVFSATLTLPESLRRRLKKGKAWSQRLNSLFHLMMLAQGLTLRRCYARSGAGQRV